MYIYIYGTLSSIATAVNLLLKSCMVLWVEKVWGWLTIASEVSRLSACPFHCGTSSIPWFLLGLAFGFLAAALFFGFLLVIWIFRSELGLLVVARPVRSSHSSRLARYLE